MKPIITTHVLAISYRLFAKLMKLNSRKVKTKRKTINRVKAIIFVHKRNNLPSKRFPEQTLK